MAGETTLTFGGDGVAVTVAGRASRSKLPHRAWEDDARSERATRWGMGGGAAALAVRKGALAKVEVHRRMGVEADERIEREVALASDEGDAEVGPVERVEDAAGAEAHAAAHRVARAVARPKGARSRARAVEEPPVIRMVAVRGRVPPRLAAAEREGSGADADGNAVEVRRCGVAVAVGADGYLEVRDGARTLELQAQRRRGIHSTARAADRRRRGGSAHDVERIVRARRKRRLAAHGTVAAESISDKAHREAIG